MTNICTSMPFHDVAIKKKSLWQYTIHREVALHVIICMANVTLFSGGQLL